MSKRQLHAWSMNLAVQRREAEELRFHYLQNRYKGPAPPDKKTKVLMKAIQRKHIESNLQVGGSNRMKTFATKLQAATNLHVEDVLGTL